MAQEACAEVQARAVQDANGLLRFWISYRYDTKYKPFKSVKVAREIQKWPEHVFYGNMFVNALRCSTIESFCSGQANNRFIKMIHDRKYQIVFKIERPTTLILAQAALDTIRIYLSVTPGGEVFFKQFNLNSQKEYEESFNKRNFNGFFSNPLGGIYPFQRTVEYLLRQGFIKSLVNNSSFGNFGNSLTNNSQQPWDNSSFGNFGYGNSLTNNSQQPWDNSSFGNFGYGNLSSTNNSQQQPWDNSSFGNFGYGNLSSTNNSQQQRWNNGWDDPFPDFNTKEKQQKKRRIKN